MEKLSSPCANRRGLLAKGDNRSNQVLDSEKYMNIDEFIQVLREVEQITPFGRLHSNVDVTCINRDEFRNVELFGHQMDRRNYNRPRKEIIPLTSVVLQVLEMDRNLRDIDTKTGIAPMPYGPQHTKEIVEESIVTNYLLQLLTHREETS